MESLDINPDEIEDEIYAKVFRILFQQSIIDDILWMAAQAKAAGATPIILLTPTRRGFDATTTALDQNLSSQAIAAGYHVFNVYDIIDTVPNNGQYDAYNSVLHQLDQKII